MNLTRENEAINAYLKLLQTKGADEAALLKRTVFLDKLIANLAGKALNGKEYREAIEAAMDSIPADDWHVSLTVAREFYPFWIRDIKAIVAFSLHSGFDIKSTQWKPAQATLESLWSSLDTEKFDAAENWPLKAYAQALRHGGAEQPLVDARIRLAKVILMRLRDAPVKNIKTYRTVVDLTLPMFNIKQNRYLFLVVVREFYHFWTGNPDATDMVLKDISDIMLE